MVLLLFGCDSLLVRFRVFHFGWLRVCVYIFGVAIVFIIILLPYLFFSTSIAVNFHFNTLLSCDMAISMDIHTQINYMKQKFINNNNKNQNKKKETTAVHQRPYTLFVLFISFVYCRAMLIHSHDKHWIFIYKHKCKCNWTFVTTTNFRKIDALSFEIWQDFCHFDSCNFHVFILCEIENAFLILQ